MLTSGLIILWISYHNVFFLHPHRSHYLRLVEKQAWHICDVMEDWAYGKGLWYEWEGWSLGCEYDFFLSILVNALKLLTFLRIKM